MTKRQTVSINIPFGGFYESKWSGEIDQIEQQTIENWTADGDGNEEESERRFPEEIQLDERELWNCLSSAADYSAAYAHIAREYVSYFDEYVSDEIGISLALEFEEMTSPREYNFETDRLFVRIPLKAVRAMFAASKAEKHATLAAVIERRFTSRSGFHSYYSNDLCDWLDKPLRDWDHNELGTLLIATMERAGVGEDDGQDYEWPIYERMSECSEFDHAFDQCVDWPKLETLKAEAREEKRLELIEADPERAIELGLIDGHDAIDCHGLPVVRCSLTADLFEARA